MIQILFIYGVISSGMKLNSNKIENIVISRSHTQSQVFSDLLIDSTCIDPCDSVSLLGIAHDYKFTLKLTSKICQLEFLERLAYCGSVKIYLMLMVLFEEFLLLFCLI